MTAPQTLLPRRSRGWLSCPVLLVVALLAIGAGGGLLFASAAIPLVFGGR